MFPGIGILVYLDGPRSVYRDMPISRYMEFSDIPDISWDIGIL